jgi:hypothetical protein
MAIAPSLNMYTLLNAWMAVALKAVCPKGYVIDVEDPSDAFTAAAPVLPIHRM